MPKHFVIPDCQVKPGVPLDHLAAAGRYAAIKKPDLIVQIGDFADMSSLSSYDVGKKAFEGRTYAADIEVARLAMSILMTPIVDEQQRQRRNKEKVWKPRLILTLGNHEQRINKAINNDRKLEGLISVADLGYETWGWEVYDFLDPVNVDGIMYCLEHSHRVLTSDLRYVALKDLKIGDSIIGFDEFIDDEVGCRKYKTSTVEKLDFELAQLYSVTLSNGKVFKTTADHLWLVKDSQGSYVWKKTIDLTPEHEINPLFDVWDELTTKDAGWLSGFFDGEGHLGKPNSKQGGLHVGFGQNDGAVFKKAIRLINVLGFKTLTYDNSRCIQVKIGGPSNDKLKFLGSIRPIRLLNKFKPEMLGRVQKRDNIPSVYVVAVTLSDVGTIAKIQTSTRTMIVDGYAHHNCHYFTSGVMGRPVTTAQALLTKKHMSCIAGHQQGKQIATAERADGTRITGIIAGSFYQHDEDYLYAQGNKHWRGCFMLHEVNNGQCDEMFISLDYLRKKYRA